MYIVYEEIDKLYKEVEELQKYRDKKDPELKEKRRQLNLLLMSVNMSYF